MIDLGEENFYWSEKRNAIICDVVENPTDGNKVIKQIIQDHEESKKCREFHYREHQAIKDRQIVKRLKERIKIHDEVKKELKEKLQSSDSQAELFQACQSDMLNELQKIRDGKK